jgi:hypothetical protein
MCTRLPPNSNSDTECPRCGRRSHGDKPCITDLGKTIRKETTTPPGQPSGDENKGNEGEKETQDEDKKKHKEDLGILQRMFPCLRSRM